MNFKEDKTFKLILPSGKYFEVKAAQYNIFSDRIHFDSWVKGWGGGMKKVATFEFPAGTVVYELGRVV